MVSPRRTAREFGAKWHSAAPVRESRRSRRGHLEITMSNAFQPLSLLRLVLRLAAYLAIFGVCGAVTAYELYYAVFGVTTTATIIMFGKRGFAQRTTSYWADYEYVDTHGNVHVARADPVHPATQVGEEVEVQYLRHAPDISRLSPGPVKGLCFGAVALLAAVVFVAELVVRWRQRRIGFESGGHPD
jgi:hypothetical protein